MWSTKQHICHGNLPWTCSRTVFACDTFALNQFFWDWCIGSLWLIGTKSSKVVSLLPLLLSVIMCISLEFYSNSTKNQTCSVAKTDIFRCGLLFNQLDLPRIDSTGWLPEVSGWWGNQPLASRTRHAWDHAGYCPSLELINGPTNGAPSLTIHCWRGKQTMGNLLETFHWYKNRKPFNFGDQWKRAGDLRHQASRSKSVKIPGRLSILASRWRHQVVVTKVRSAKSWTLSRAGRY